jgi:hypothetical protein
LPISFRIDPDRRRIYTRAQGVVTSADLLAHMNADVTDEVASYSEIFDCTGAATNITPEELRKLADERAKIGRQRPPGALAVVATNNNFFGMFRIYETRTEHVRSIRVFREIGKAEEWLDKVTQTRGE